MATTQKVRGLRVPAVVGAAAYSWWAGGFRPFTHPMEVAVALPVVLALAASLRPGRGEDETPPDRLGAAMWIGLTTLLVTWELIAYFSSPRHDHPTLSSIADDIMSTHPGRSLMFGLWLALGWRLFARSGSRITGPR